MTKIAAKSKSINQLASEHCARLKSYIEQADTNYKLDDLNCDLLHIFDMDFEQIVTALPKSMRELIPKAPNSYTSSILSLKKLYEVFRNKWSSIIMEELNLNVCPYCNREYIFKFEDTKKAEARVIATFDHYYDKDSYPFLAVSFFNLIPCCSLCNSKFKHSENFYKKLHLHPYEESFNDRAKFHLKIENCDFCHLEDGFEVKLFPNNSNDDVVKNSIATFRLDNLYKHHKDIVLELIQKAEIYNESYIDELMKNYEGTLFKNREDLIRLIFGGYITDEEISKRPLSKLTKDILEQLEII